MEDDLSLKSTIQSVMRQDDNRSCDNRGQANSSHIKLTHSTHRHTAISFNTFTTHKSDTFRLQNFAA